MNSIIPVILCGGSGTRLWPLSRDSYPKQYLSLLTDDKKSLLQKTQERINNFKEAGNPILVCSEDQRFLVAEQMREINIDPLSILLEPLKKNTAPAVTLAAIKALQKEKDPILLILSSDHNIKDEEKFVEVLKNALTHTNNEKLVTFGVVPTSAETGFGYIEAERSFRKKTIEGLKIKKFIEKPNQEKANRLFLDKKFTWNSGIFMFKAKTIIEEIKLFAPEIFECCQRAIEFSKNDLDFQRLDKNSFVQCPNNSFDKAIMEKTSKGIVLPLDVGWSDIGSWSSVWENSAKDKNGNVLKGKIISEQNEDCYLRGESRLLVGLGLKNLFVIETSDAVLVAEKNYSQNIKNIVQKLKKKGIQEGKSHKKIYRPWGNYLSLVNDKKWQVKIIEVLPGERLSLQMHHHRSEHWVVVRGIADVEIDDKKIKLYENQSTFIPLGSKHRLSNSGDIKLQIIEIQTGSYISEDDIERFDDKYGRLI